MASAEEELANLNGQHSISVVVSHFLGVPTGGVCFGLAFLARVYLELGKFDYFIKTLKKIKKAYSKFGLNFEYDQFPLEVKSLLEAIALFQEPSSFANLAEPNSDLQQKNLYFKSMHEEMIPNTIAKTCNYTFLFSVAELVVLLQTIKIQLKGASFSIHFDAKGHTFFIYYDNDKKGWVLFDSNAMYKFNDGIKYETVLDRLVQLITPKMYVKKIDNIKKFFVEFYLIVAPALHEKLLINDWIGDNLHAMLRKGQGVEGISGFFAKLNSKDFHALFDMSFSWSLEEQDIFLDAFLAFLKTRNLTYRKEIINNIGVEYITYILLNTLLFHKQYAKFIVAFKVFFTIFDNDDNYDNIEEFINLLCCQPGYLEIIQKFLTEVSKDSILKKIIKQALLRKYIDLQSIYTMQNMLHEISVLLPKVYEIFLQVYPDEKLNFEPINPVSVLHEIITNVYPLHNNNRPRGVATKAYKIFKSTLPNGLDNYLEDNKDNNEIFIWLALMPQDYDKFKKLWQELEDKRKLEVLTYIFATGHNRFTFLHILIAYNFFNPSILQCVLESFPISMVIPDLLRIYSCFSQKSIENINLIIKHLDAGLQYVFLTLPCKKYGVVNGTLPIFFWLFENNEPVFQKLLSSLTPSNLYLILATATESYPIIVTIFLDNIKENNLEDKYFRICKQMLDSLDAQHKLMVTSIIEQKYCGSKNSLIVKLGLREKKAANESSMTIFSAGDIVVPKAIQAFQGKI